MSLFASRPDPDPCLSPLGLDGALRLLPGLRSHEARSSSGRKQGLCPAVLVMRTAGGGVEEKGGMIGGEIWVFTPWNG